MGADGDHTIAGMAVRGFRNYTLCIEISFIMFTRILVGVVPERTVTESMMIDSVSNQSSTTEMENRNP